MISAWWIIPIVIASVLVGVFVGGACRDGKDYDKTFGIKEQEGEP